MPLEFSEGKGVNHLYCYPARLVGFPASVVRIFTAHMSCDLTLDLKMSGFLQQNRPKIMRLVSLGARH